MENKNKNLKTWWVYGKMTQCFEGFLGDVEAETEEEALSQAFDLVVENYESFAGLHGIPSRDEIEDEVAEQCPDGYTEEDVDDAYYEAVNDNVSYWVKEALPGVDPDDYYDEHNFD